MTTAASAALLAIDNASNAPYGDGWQSGDNGGSGWGGPWALTISGLPANSGHFIFDSTTNGDGADNGIVGGVTGDGDINTAGPAAWGMYANSSQSARAFRPFAGALDVGQGFSIDIDNGFMDAGAGVGFNLRTAASFVRLSALFLGGGANYRVYDGVFQDSGVGYTDEGVRIDFLLTAADSYSVKFTRRDGVSNTLTGTLDGSGGITQVELFNSNAGSGSSNDAYFNSMAVTPEPACGVLLGIAVVALSRRRRV